MLEELTINYNPEEILHREEQIKKILNVFETFKNNGIGSNILIQGSSGCGKTLVIKNIIQKLGNTVYGCGSLTKSSFKTLKSMFDIKCNTEGTLLMKIIEGLKKSPKIIIIDEINKINDLTNLFNNLNTIYREISCPIILITNNRNIFHQMPEDARLTLFFERVEFPPYNALELYDIINQRLSLIKNVKLNIPEGQLRKICAIAVKDSSARTLLILTFRCALNNDFSDKNIERVIKNLHEEEWRDFLNNLKKTEKDFLINLLDLQTTKKEMYPSDFTKLMKDFTPSRISKLITYFEDYGIIESKYKNLGRAGGRMRAIKFISPEVFDKINELMVE